MVTDDVQNLKRTYGLVDYIAKVVSDCQLEQMAQAAQMRRIEGRLDTVEKYLLAIIDHLGINPDQPKTKNQ